MKEPMTVTEPVRLLGASLWEPNQRHKICLGLAWLAAGILVVGLAIHGYAYYRLPLAKRIFSPEHASLKPSGLIGLRLGILGLLLFCFLYLYLIRKRWSWLARIGKTKHWLDFHVLFGTMAPVIITFHSSFKFQGLAGVAYWIMMAVMISGIVGRYLYALVPRSISSLEMSLKEMQEIIALQSRQLGHQALVSGRELEPLFKVPSAGEARRMSLGHALLTLFWLDVSRPFLVARVRRQSISWTAKLITLGGLCPTKDEVLETIVSTAKRQSLMLARILFLDRIHQLFHWWHIVHRPFSYSFALLVLVHIGVALWLGYF
ncbi:MAG: hypothetical protein U0V70_06690 [Terriglobia bacterium]